MLALRLVYQSLFTQFRLYESLIEEGRLMGLTLGLRPILSDGLLVRKRVVAQARDYSNCVSEHLIGSAV